MYTGKTLFAQLMDFLPWTTFNRIVTRYNGDLRVRTLTCSEQFRILAFAQLTYRESLRDIEVCLAAQAGKLYHMGLRRPVARATLADANETRDWRIYAEFAQRLIAQARTLYLTESFGVDLTNTVYALDSTTIDLCLSVFPWAHFRKTKAAVKMHTLLDLRGNIPTFIHISDGKLGDVNVLDILIPEAGAFYVMDRGYIDFAPSWAAFGARVVRNPRQIEYAMPARLFQGHGTRRRHYLRSGHRFDWCANIERLSVPYAAHPFQRPGIGKNIGVPDQRFSVASVDHLRPLQKSLASGIVFQMDQAASSHQTVLWHIGERSQISNLDCGLSLCPGCDCQKETQPGRFALHIATDIIGVRFRENPATASVCGRQRFLKIRRFS